MERGVRTEEASPQDIQAKLNDALVQALDDEATRKRLLANWL